MTKNGSLIAPELLVVDDEEDIRELIAGILGDEGYTTRVAADSDSALAASRSSGADSRRDNRPDTHQASSRTVSARAPMSAQARRYRSAITVLGREARTTACAGPSYRTGRNAASDAPSRTVSASPSTARVRSNPSCVAVSSSKRRESCSANR